MAPSKFEKHIKKQLEEREIQPSANAWERLSEKLDVDEPQSKKRYYLWYGLAASFIGFLIISFVYINTTKDQSTNIQVVENPVKSSELINDELEINVQTEVEKIVEFDAPIAEKKDFKNSITNKIDKPQKAITRIEKRNGISENIELPLKDSEEVINIKIMEVVAQVDLLEQQDESLTDAEVDSLLRKAQNEILNDKLFRNARSVDAMALLTEVEDELDKSFRDQIFESLKNGFLKVRTAVADRNN